MARPVKVVVVVDLLDSGVLTAVDVAVKSALRRDPATLRRLARLDGRVIALRFSIPKLQLFVFPVTDGLEFSSRPPAHVDCSVEGSAADFLEVLLDEHKTFDSDICLRGDTQLAIDLKNCLQRLDIDWEGLLADRVGDLAGHQLAEWFRTGRNYLRQSRETLLDDIDDYLHEEIRLLPPAAELEQFYDQVDLLRLSVDRLQARVERLNNRLADASTD